MFLKLNIYFDIRRVGLVDTRTSSPYFLCFSVCMKKMTMSHCWYFFIPTCDCHWVSLVGVYLITDAFSMLRLQSPSIISENSIFYDISSSSNLSFLGEFVYLSKYFSKNLLYGLQYVKMLSQVTLLKVFTQCQMHDSLFIQAISSD